MDSDGIRMMELQDQTAFVQQLHASLFCMYFFVKSSDKLLNYLMLGQTVIEVKLEMHF